MYIWGGGHLGPAFNDLFCCDTISHSWSKPIVSGVIPGGRVGHSACVYNDSMWIFGGIDLRHPLGEQFYFEDVFKLDLKSLKWSHVPTKVY